MASSPSGQGGLRMFDINEIRKRAQQASASVKKTFEKSEELIDEQEQKYFLRSSLLCRLRRKALLLYLHKDESQNHFVCSNYKSNTGSCQIHYIHEVTLYKRILECIRGTLTYVRLFRENFIQEMLERD